MENSISQITMEERRRGRIKEGMHKHGAKVLEHPEVSFFKKFVSFAPTQNVLDKFQLLKILIINI